MSLLFDEETAKEQGRSKGPQPRYEGQIKTVKWTPELRYHKNQLGISSINSHDNRRERKRHSKIVNAGYRGKMKRFYRKVTNRPLG